MSVPALVDTNILVYRFDPRFPDKQRVAHDLLRDGIASGDVALAHQTIVELIAAVTRPPRRSWAGGSQSPRPQSRPPNASELHEHPTHCQAVNRR